MYQLRWLGALIAAFAIAIAAGIYLGNGHAGSSHEFAFVMRETCGEYPQQFDCSSIYIAKAEAIPPLLRQQDSRALPPGTQKLLTRPESMAGLSWSPYGRELVYTVIRTNVSCTVQNLLPCNTARYDRWVITAEGSDDHQIGANVFDPLLLAPFQLPADRVNGRSIRGEGVSPDGKLTVFTMSLGGYGSICVSAGALDAASRRCFGAAVFGAPLWRPRG